MKSTKSSGVLAPLALILGVALAPQAHSQDSADAADLEEVIVTGSRIPRLDPQLVTPVQIYDAEFIANTGAANIQDFLFSASFAGPSLFNENATLSQTAGTANFDSRGFGDDYVVILLNGRRLPADPLGGDAATNLNLIPINAVDRIEYLSTGASAIYGADAVQGVINVITKQRFEGLQLTTRYDDSMNQDGGRVGLAITGGVASERGFATVSFEFQRQADVDAEGLPLIGSTIAPDGTDGRSPTGLPGTWVNSETSVSTAAADCPSESVRPTSVANTGNECAFDFASLYDALPAQERFTFLTSAEYLFTENVTAYAEFRMARNVTEVRNGAAPAFFNITGASFLPEVDAELGTDLSNSSSVFILRRSVDAGPRATDNTNTAFSTVLGSRIQLGENHQLDINVMNVESEMNRVGVGAGNLSLSALSNAVLTGVLDPRLTYDPQFYQDNGISVSIQRQAVGTETTLNAEFIGQIGDTGIGYSVGGQYKDDSFEDLADIASTTEDVAGGASSNGAGDRDSTSLFGELSYSPIEAIEISLAARWDDYSWEGAGVSSGDSAVTYMGGVSFRPLDNLMLRASAGTGYKAPTLGELFLGRSFGVTTATDTTICNQVTQDPNSTQEEIDSACRQVEIRSAGGGNPLLETESSTNWSVGLVYEPTDNWSIAVDYYRIEVEDKIGSLTVQEIINNEQEFPELVTRVNGTLTLPGAEVRSNLQNLNEENGAGIDFSTRANWDFATGQIVADMRVAYLMEHERQLSALQPLCDDAGGTSEPEWRINGQLGWQSASRWSTTLVLRYLGSTEDLPGGRDTANRSCDVNPSIPAKAVDSYLELGLRATYAFSDAIELSAGIINLTDEDPPFSEQAPSGGGGWPFFDQSLYDPRGTRFYLNLSYDFL